MPPSALQGMAESADTVLAEFGVKTIKYSLILLTPTEN